MSGILTIDEKFITSIFERTGEALTDGLAFERNKKEINLSSNEPLIEGISSHLCPELIRDLIEICFVASLEKEEGRYYNFSVALTSPEHISGSKFQFQNPIEFNPGTLTKLSPAINPNYFSICAWFSKEGNLEIWGFSEINYPHFTLSSSTPGKIILNCAIGLEKSFKCFISMVETGFVSLNSPYGNPVAEWFTKHSTREENMIYFYRNSDVANILLNMFSHGNGGTILLVRHKDGDWLNSIQQPILYTCPDAYQDKRITEKYKTIEEYMKETYGKLGEISERELLEKVLKKLSEGLSSIVNVQDKFSDKFSINDLNAKNAFFDLGNLTKVDGATVLSKNFEVIAFGAKIKPVDANHKPEKIVEITPFENCNPKVILLPAIGGTRHQSAAQFVFDQKDLISVVASHDGNLSVFWWQPEVEAVIRMKNFEAMIG